MVVFYLRNGRSPFGKIVPVTVALSNEAVLAFQNPTRPDQDPTATGVEFPNLIDPEGDGIWLLTVSTTERDSAGDLIPTEIINLVSKSTVHLELEAALGRIGSKIDWGPLSPDIQPPRLFSITPGLEETDDVSIASNIILRLQDPLPAAGMDLSTLNIRLNDFPIVTSGVTVPDNNVQFQGNIFDLTITHRPERIA